MGTVIEVRSQADVIQFLPIDAAAGAFDEAWLQDVLAHLVAAGTTEGQSWSVPPIPRGAPRLRSEPDSEDDHLDIGDFTEDQVEEALGDLAPMLAAYEDDRLYDGPDLYKLLDGLLRVVGPEVIECSVELDAWSSETEFCYFSADASTVRPELAALYDRLQAGLDHLAEITRTDSRAS